MASSFYSQDLYWGRKHPHSLEAEPARVEETINAVKSFVMQDKKKRLWTCLKLAMGIKVPVSFLKPFGTLGRESTAKVMIECGKKRHWS